MEKINQPQNMQQGQAPQASPMNANIGLANYAPTESVGKVMDLTYSGEQGSQVGGGVALASSNHNLVWASRDGKREVFASNQKGSSSNKILNFSQSILNLKQNLNNDAQIQKSIDNVIRVANERSKNIKMMPRRAVRPESFFISRLQRCVFFLGTDIGFELTIL